MNFVCLSHDRVTFDVDRDDDKEYKIPLLVLNSAINPVAYAFFKRDIKEEVERHICCVVLKKRNNIEPLNDSRLFLN